VRDLGFAGFLGVIWLYVAQVTPAFATDPVVSTPGDAVAQQHFWKVIGGSEGFQMGSSPSASTPEPGIVAVLGFGLLLLGASCRRADRWSRRFGDSMSAHRRDAQMGGAGSSL
jgi:hypothetical protein